MAKSRRATPTATRRPTTQGRPAKSTAATAAAAQQAETANARRTPPPAARARQAPARPAAPKAATEQTEFGYKVRAIETGYYDHARRRPGDVFLIAKPEHFSERWMEYVDAATPERISTANQEIRRKN